MNAPSAAQSPQAQSEAAVLPKFDVASIKPIRANAGAGGSKGLDGGRGSGGGAPLQIDHRRFYYTSSLFGFIIRAYNLQGCVPYQHRDAGCFQEGWTGSRRTNLRFKLRFRTILPTTRRPNSVGVRHRSFSLCFRRC